MNVLKLSALLLLIACSGQNATNTTSTAPAESEAVVDQSANILQQLQGVWVSTDDNSSIIEIAESQFTFSYVGTETQEYDKYSISIGDSIPGVPKPEVKSDYILLSNSSGSMNYELMSLSENDLSMMYLDRGNILSYQRKN